MLTKLDVAVGAIFAYLVSRYVASRGKPPLPPGPQGIPVVGNVADMPTQDEWLTFAEWGKKYGGIVSVNLLGRTMIIVNSHEIMEELARKGSLYGNRPRLEMGGELVGYNETLVLINGPRWRTYRKYFSNFFGPSPMQNQMHTVEQYTRRFLKRQLIQPDNLEQNLRTLAGGIILMLAYGIEVKEQADPFVELIEQANSNFNKASVPGAFMVDLFPSIRHLPEWLPGMGFMETARGWAKDTLAMIEVPFAYTKEKMADGSAPSSFVTDTLEKEASLTEEQIWDIKAAASSMYGGGADTTVSSEHAFFLAMTLYPEVQKKAQAELDSVVGTGRLPTLADRPSLPYISAIVSEVLRWHSVAPLGVPRAASEDGMISGYFIPKDSLILTNIWFLLHDPEVYPEPFVFDPDRFIEAPGRPVQRDPRTACFGWGRRVCPGMHLAEPSVFLTVALSLAVFNITKVVENGVEITPVHENTCGTISYPKPFKCMVKPRSEKAVELINLATE